MRWYRDPIVTVLTARARRDLEFLTRVANVGAAEQISPIEYLKDFVDAGLLERASQLRRGERQ